MSDAVSSTTEQYSARPEAQPVPWTDLTEDQKSAARQVCGILGDLAERPWAPTTRKDHGVEVFLPQIDTERHNHVVLIDGGRGSGKTALLMTLLYAWSMKVRDGKPAVELPPATLFSDKHRIIPIGLIDLQPLPKSANLLVDLVGQLVRVVEAIESDGRDKEASEPPARRRSPAPWHATELEESAVAKAWRDFLVAAAGWNVGMEGRRANLDLEAYALEVDQWRKRLDATTRCFRAFGDALVEAYSAWQRLPKGQAPLFVVAIDDADMNPNRTRELLDLVRTLWHPRVAFLMTGHTELFLKVLEKDFNSESVQLLQEQVGTAFYDKVVPPPHRCALKHLPVPERLRILEPTLKSVPAPPHPWLALSSLEQYVRLQVGVADLLPGNLRALRDIEPVLQRSGRQGARRIAQASNYPRVFGSDWETGTRYIWPLFQFGKQSILYQFRFYLSLTNAAPDSGTIEAVHRDHDGGLGDFSHTPPGYAGLLVRARVISPANPSESLVVPWPLPDLDRPIDYALLSYLLNRTCGLEQVGDTAKFAVRPDATTFAKRFVQVILAYGEANQRFIERAQKIDLSEFEANVIAQAALPSWKELAERCVRLWKLGADTREQPFQNPVAEWAFARAGLLAAPESGLPADIANDWISTLRESFVAHDAQAWEACMDRLRNERAARLAVSRGQAQDPYLASYGDPPTPQLLHGLELAFPDYVWGTEIQPSPEVLEQQILRGFASVSVVARDAPILNLSVAFYARPHRLRGLRRATRKTIGGWLRAMQDFGMSAGGAPFLLKSMFRIAAENKDVPANLSEIGIDSAALWKVVRDLAGERDAWVFSGDNPAASAVVSDKLHVGKAAYDWAEGIGLRGTVAGSLLETAWDVVMDAENTLDGATCKSLVSSQWSAVTTSIHDEDEIRFVPWPAVQWPALLDQLMLAEAWNATVVPVVPAATAAARGSNKVADAVAFWFVMANVQLARGRNPSSVQVDLGLTSKEWLDRYQGLEREIRQSPPNRRWTALREWLPRLALLATPESGLSHDIANGILSQVLQSTTGRETAWHARNQRLVACGVPKERLTKVLQDIDNAAPGYDWRKAFDPSKPPGTYSKFDDPMQRALLEDDAFDSEPNGPNPGKPPGDPTT